jgi:hypothetical protein
MRSSGPSTGQAYHLQVEEQANNQGTKIANNQDTSTTDNQSNQVKPDAKPPIITADALPASGTTHFYQGESLFFLISPNFTPTDNNAPSNPIPIKLPEENISIFLVHKEDTIYFFNPTIHSSICSQCSLSKEEAE